LVFIWLKFNVIWKISRCWALWDGIEVHENMNRCGNNNYSMIGFWRAGHRGFNQWLIRYLFIPLGKI
jgi:D-alanyl-lipoteichoic acid acyltransferase DltB (MBOAT superfamily)